MKISRHYLMVHLYGTETRDLLPINIYSKYESYAVFRYFENIQPGKNDGGWVDTGGLRYIDRYAEQLWLTLFAKAPQITLFDIRQMLYPLNEDLRPSWQGIFNFEEMKSLFGLKMGVCLRQVKWRVQRVIRLKLWTKS